MAEKGLSTVLPSGAVEWTLTNPRRNEQRTYQQTELTIEGEARLLSLARVIGLQLREHNIEWGPIEGMLEDGAKIDWPLVWEILGLVSEQATELVVETTCVFFGIFPNELDGTRNEQYDDEKAFLAGAINFARWTDIIRTFVEQNDYVRLARPFGRALGMLPTPGSATPPSPEQPQSSSETDTAEAIPAGSSAT